MLEELEREAEAGASARSELERENASLRARLERLGEDNVALQKNLRVGADAQRTKKQFTMLEIENEKFESETRVKDEKISDLENKASRLTEKVLMLKFEVKDQEHLGQKMERRFRDELRDLTDELEVLKQKKHALLRPAAGQGPERGGAKSPKNRVSIMVMGVELEELGRALPRPSLGQQKSQGASEQSPTVPEGLPQACSESLCRSSQERGAATQK